MPVGKLHEAIVVPAKVDLSHLEPNDRKVLSHLVKAADAVGTVFWKQQSPHGLPIYNFVRKVSKYAKAKSAPQFKDYLDYLDLNQSFYDEIDGFKKFVPEFTPKDVQKAIANAPRHRQAALLSEFEKVREPIFSPGLAAQKPAGGTMYDPSITKEQLDKILASSDPAHAQAKKAIANPYSNLSVDAEGNFVATPFSKVHKKQLETAAAHLRKAANLTKNNSLREYLRSRANSLLSDHYQDSDRLWLKADSDVNVIIGPVETYLDAFAGRRSGMEAVVYARDPQITALFDKFKKHAQALEDALPCKDDYKNEKVKVPPIEAVQAIHTTGDSKGVMQAIASVLPNDESLHQKHGTRITYFANIDKAKSALSTIIRKEAFSPATFKGFSEGELMAGSRIATIAHEMSHPSGKSKDGRGLDSVFGEHSDNFGETKAYTLELLKADQLEKMGVITQKERDAAYCALATDIIRHGMQAAKAGSLTRAHQRALMTIYNHLAEDGAMAIRNGRFDLDLPKARASIGSLSAKLLKMQGESDYAAANDMFAKYATLPKAFVSTIQSIKLPRAIHSPLPKFKA